MRYSHHKFTCHSECLFSTYTNSFCLVNFPLIFSHFLFKWHWDRIRFYSIVMKPVIKPPENWSDSMPTIGRSDLIWCVKKPSATLKWSPFLEDKNNFDNLKSGFYQKNITYMTLHCETNTVWFSQIFYTCLLILNLQEMFLLKATFS